MATRIRIPIQKLRDAALADMDVSMFGDVSPVATSADERLRRMKLLDEKTGWLDTTDVTRSNPGIISRPYTAWLLESANI